MVAIEILRNRLTIEPGEGSISVRLAAAPFANYDTKSKAERDSPEEIEKLVNQIELAAEQTMNARGRNKGGQKGRDSLHLTDAYNPPDTGTRQPCEGCGKTHAGGIAACYANAERVLAEREAYLAAKNGKGEG